MKRSTEKSNITLIGMAGCGKSTVGVLLAKAKNLLFADTDLLLQQQHGKYLWEMLEEEGVKAFLRKESDLIFALDCAHTCIATGGSAVYSEAAMAHLKAISTVVFLDVAYDEIARRVADIKSRGVVMERGRSLRELYDERLPLYARYADLRVDANKSTAEQVVEAVLEALGE